MFNLLSTIILDKVSDINLNWIGKIISVICDKPAYGIGVGVILFTLILKLITMPFDIMSKVSTKKNALKMEKMRPELEKLQKQYANNKQVYHSSHYWMNRRKVKNIRNFRRNRDKLNSHSNHYYPHFFSFSSH